MGAFDDLLPKGATAPASTFDDLIPKAPKSGVIASAAKRTGGSMLSAAGTTLEDIAGQNRVSDALKSKGQEIVQANPGSINSFSDVLAHPLDAVKEGVGQMIPQIPAALAGRAAGAALGGAVAGPIGAAVGGVLGGLAPIGVQEYGGIRETQKQEGTESIPKALAAAVPATALELIGPEGKIIRGALRPTAGSIASNALKEGAKAVAVNAPQEAAQTALERAGAGQSLTDSQALSDYGVSAALGAAGGGPVGAVTGALETMLPAQSKAPPAIEAAAAAGGPISGAVKAGYEAGAIQTNQNAQMELYQRAAEGIDYTPTPVPGPSTAAGASETAPQDAIPFTPANKPTSLTLEPEAAAATRTGMDVQEAQPEDVGEIPPVKTGSGLPLPDVQQAELADFVKRMVAQGKPEEVIVEDIKALPIPDVSEASLEDYVRAVINTQGRFAPRENIEIQPPAEAQRFDNPASEQIDVQDAEQVDQIPPVQTPAPRTSDPGIKVGEASPEEFARAAERSLPIERIEAAPLPADAQPEPPQVQSAQPETDNGQEREGRQAEALLNQSETPPAASATGRGAEQSAPASIEPYGKNAIIIRAPKSPRISAMKGVLWNAKAGGYVAPKRMEATVRANLADMLEANAADQPATEAAAFDPRLKNETFRAALRSFRDAPIKGGGVEYIRDASGDTIVGRTPSLNPQWFQSMIADGSVKSRADLANVVNKALAGKPLTERQQAVVRDLLDMHERESAEADLEMQYQDWAERQTDRYEHEPPALLSNDAFTIDELFQRARNVSEESAVAAMESSSDNQAASKLFDIIQNPEAYRAQTRAPEQPEQDQPQGSGQGDAVVPAGEGGREVSQAEVLQPYTEQDLADRQAAIDAAESARKAEEAKAEQKAQADSERESFTLTGSDREADTAAAAGQGSIFDQPAAPPSAETVTPPVTEGSQPAKPGRTYATYQEQQDAIDRVAMAAGRANASSAVDAIEYGAPEHEVMAAIDKGEDAIIELASRYMRSAGGMKQGFGTVTPNLPGPKLSASGVDQAVTKYALTKALYKMPENDRATLLRAAGVKSIDGFESLSKDEREAAARKWLQGRPDLVQDGESSALKPAEDIEPAKPKKAAKQKDKPAAETSAETPPAEEPATPPAEPDIDAMLADPRTAAALKGMKVKIKARIAETGKIAIYEESADVAVKDIAERLAKLRQLMECVRA